MDLVALGQLSILKTSEISYFTPDEYKTTFHYKYTPQDSIPKSIKTNVVGVYGSIKITADAEIEGDWVVLKKIKMAQDNNVISNVAIAFNMVDLFYRKGKQIKAKKLLKSKGVKRWSENLIKMIRQY